jgi:hypothetical protein
MLEHWQPPSAALGHKDECRVLEALAERIRLNGLSKTGGRFQFTGCTGVYMRFSGSARRKKFAFVFQCGLPGSREIAEERWFGPKRKAAPDPALTRSSAN